MDLKRIIGESLYCAEDVYRVMKPVFSEETDVEKMYGLFFDNQNTVKRVVLLASGTINEVHVYPREIVKYFIKFETTSLVLMHNHPSGILEPSLEDHQLTRKTAIAAKSIDCKLLDHIIVAGSGYFSFLNHQVMKQIDIEVDSVFKISK